MTLELGREQAWLLKHEASVLIELGVGGEEFPRNKVKNEFLLDFHLPVESLTSGKSSWSFKAMKLISTALLTQRRCSEASASKQEERCEHGCGAQWGLSSPVWGCLWGAVLLLRAGGAAFWRPALPASPETLGLVNSWSSL